MFDSFGFVFDRESLSIWCLDVAEVASPLYELMSEVLLVSHVI